MNEEFRLKFKYGDRVIIRNYLFYEDSLGVVVGRDEDHDTDYDFYKVKLEHGNIETFIDEDLEILLDKHDETIQANP